MAVGRLEQARPPRGDRQHAAGTDLPPHLRRERRHIRREENAEDAHDRVERAVRQSGARRVALAELDTGQVLVSGPGPGQFQQGPRHVDTDHTPGRAHGPGSRNGRRPCAAAKIEHAVTGRQPQPRHRCGADPAYRCVRVRGRTIVQRFYGHRSGRLGRTRTFRQLESRGPRRVAGFSLRDPQRRVGGRRSGQNDHNSLFVVAGEHSSQAAEDRAGSNFHKGRNALGRHMLDRFGPAHA